MAGQKEKGQSSYKAGRDDRSMANTSFRAERNAARVRLPKPISDNLPEFAFLIRRYVAPNTIGPFLAPGSVVPFCAENQTGNRG